MKASVQKGSEFTDVRGTLEFVNEEVPGIYRRFYIITHPKTQVVRAWQGHLHEEKAFFAIEGSFLIAVVHPENFENPGEDEKPDIFQINTQSKNFLRVPGGNYTGIKAITPGSKLLVLSSMGLAESKADDYRQPVDKWIDWSQVR